ncbi:MAG: DUF4149 domain-containing protein [Candidatus Poseidoniaceae archaeon]|jgi:uncharacterized membrane protein|nr:DUF4149 domain-containing protein [Candidatus Poseidoniaceae archaeon]
MNWSLLTLIHLFAAAIWVGSMIFFVAILVPYAKSNLKRQEYVEFLNHIGTRFRWLEWICFITIAITGIYLSDILAGWDAFVSHDGHSQPPASTIAWKMIGGFVLFLSAAIHDFYYGPKAIKTWNDKGDCNESRRLRRKATMFGRFNLVISIIIFGLGVTILRGELF